MERRRHCRCRGGELRRTLALLRRARLRNRERCADPCGAPPNARVQGGTESSNLLCSSGESGANLSLAGIRLPTSRSRGFPRVCGAGASGAVGRDAQGAATSGFRAVISLSGHIPVPHQKIVCDLLPPGRTVGPPGPIARDLRSGEYRDHRWYLPPVPQKGGKKQSAATG